MNTVQLLYGKSSFAHKMTALPKAIALRLDELTFSKDVLPSASEPGSGRSSPTATIRGSSPGEHSRSSSPTGSVARRNSLSKSNNLPLKFRKVCRKELSSFDEFRILLPVVDPVPEDLLPDEQVYRLSFLVK